MVTLVHFLVDLTWLGFTLWFGGLVFGVLQFAHVCKEGLMMAYAIEQRAAAAQIVLDSMLSGLSMRQSCIKAGIGASTWIDWVTADRELNERYARAREGLLDAMVDQILTLADAPVPLLDNGATDPGLVRQRQLQIDARRWVLSKLAPNKYGDRLDVSVSDNRISITGALQAAQSRLIDVVDVTPRALPNASSALDNASDNEGEG